LAVTHLFVDELRALGRCDRNIILSFRLLIISLNGSLLSFEKSKLKEEGQ
jgi:hypothetical protein